ncbi:MAG: NUDIX domain-containing protein [Patescibacteria group bacterium]
MHRRNKGEEYWVFPGGHIDDGESAEEAMKREIWEELSLRVIKLSKPHPYIHEFGTKECYFNCEVEEGEAKLHPSGNEKSNPEDWYNPEWVDLLLAKKLAKLYPAKVADIIKK